MEITEAQEVGQALDAKSQTTTLDELAKKGRQQVKVIRPSDVAAMITESVHRILHDTELLSHEEIDLLVQRGAQEFRQVFHERQQERQLIEQKFRGVQDELFEARNRILELESQLLGAGGAEGAPLRSGGGSGSGDGAGFSEALDRIESNLNERLEKIGKKVGVSGAVEADEIQYERLFEDDGDIESNMADFEVEKKTSGGIAGNLERLKKLKGNG